jgi:hypothetical protein
MPTFGFTENQKKKNDLGGTGWNFFAVSIRALGAQNLLCAHYGEPLLKVPGLPEAHLSPSESVVDQGSPRKHFLQSPSINCTPTE